MRGNVIGFDPDTNTGAISGHDGRRYDFTTFDWHGAGTPRHGDLVDFTPEGERAAQIYLVQPEYAAPSFGQFYFSARGRISRSQYWLRFLLPYLGVIVVLELIGSIPGASDEFRAGMAGSVGLFSLAAFWSYVVTLVKRMHDRNRSGWLSLILFVPEAVFFLMLIAWAAVALIAVGRGDFDATAVALGGFGLLVFLVGLILLGIVIWFFVEFGCMRGTVGANRFGPDPVR